MCVSILVAVLIIWVLVVLNGNNGSVTNSDDTPGIDSALQDMGSKKIGGGDSRPLEARSNDPSNVKGIVYSNFKQKGSGSKSKNRKVENLEVKAPRPSRPELPVRSERIRERLNIISGKAAKLNGITLGENTVNPEEFTGLMMATNNQSKTQNDLELGTVRNCNERNRDISNYNVSCNKMALESEAAIGKVRNEYSRDLNTHNLNAWKAKAEVDVKTENIRLQSINESAKNRIEREALTERVRATIEQERFKNRELGEWEITQRIEHYGKTQQNLERSETNKKLVRTNEKDQAHELYEHRALNERTEIVKNQMQNELVIAELRTYDEDDIEKMLEARRVSREVKILTDKVAIKELRKQLRDVRDPPIELSKAVIYSNSPNRRNWSEFFFGVPSVYSCKLSEEYELDGKMNYDMDKLTNRICGKGLLENLNPDRESLCDLVGTTFYWMTGMLSQAADREYLIREGYNRARIVMIDATLLNKILHERSPHTVDEKFIRTLCGIYNSEFKHLNIDIENLGGVIHAQRNLSHNTCTVAFQILAWRQYTDSLTVPRSLKGKDAAGDLLRKYAATKMSS